MDVCPSVSSGGSLMTCLISQIAQIKLLLKAVTNFPAQPCRVQSPFLLMMESLSEPSLQPPFMNSFEFNKYSYICIMEPTLSIEKG